MKSVSILPALKWMFASSVVKIMLNSTVLIWHNSLSISFCNQSKMCYHSMIDFCVTAYVSKQRLVVWISYVQEMLRV